jgi:hypothetical protein
MSSNSPRLFFGSKAIDTASKQSNNGGRKFHYKRLAILSVLWIVVDGSLGCRAIRNLESQGPVPTAQTTANPLIVPMIDRWFVMDEISDEVDDYFRVKREERIRMVDGVMSEGWIETWPRMGSTLLEPWHHDSTRGYEKVHSTLQTIRRSSKIRVIPTGDSYAIDVKVFKELEDNDRPIGSPLGGNALRSDNALDVDRLDDSSTGDTRTWIPLGRDISLEQRILRNVQQRLAYPSVGQ